jgi:ferredoxin/flavodoxin---NADP+ reductase
MFNVVNKQILGKDVKRLDIQAPQIAQKVRPGHFVIVIPHERSERIPMAVLESDIRKGTLALIFRELGETTRELGAIPIGGEIFSMIGPLGKPTALKKEGIVVCVATGIGTAQLLPICRAAKTAGNKVIGIIGAKTRRDLLLEPQIRLSCNKLYIATNDGSFERRGLATTVFKELLQKEKVNLVYAIGSLDMMQEIAEMTRERSIKYLIQANTHMLCGVGLCASCRMRMAGEIILACQHGPEFDGHEVDYEFLKMRVQAYQKQSAEMQKTGKQPEGNDFDIKHLLSDFLRP